MFSVCGLLLEVTHAMDLKSFKLDRKSQFCLLRSKLPL